jgi:competence protein ComFA
MNGMDQRIYNQLVQALQGRLLLIEEVQQVIEHLNLRIASSWMSYVQLGQLKGDIAITNGIHVQEQRLARSFWKSSLKYTCQRCGSGPERMNWTRCVFCGGECPYCEECLTMGRTRFCSLLVQGWSKGNNLLEALPAYQGYTAYLTPWGLSTAQAVASLEAAFSRSGHVV